MTETLPDVLRHADEAQESIGAMSRVAPKVLTAPIAHDVLSKLEALAYQLAPVFDQISAGLTRALEEFDTYEHDGDDPEINTATARAFLGRAGQLALQMGEFIDEAKTAISEQGHRVA